MLKFSIPPKSIFLKYVIMISAGFLLKANAQDYKPLKNNIAMRDAYIQSQEEDYKRLNSEYTRGKDPHKKEFKQILKIRWKANTNRAYAGHYLFDNYWLQYLETIRDEIARNNAKFDFDHVQVVLGRYDIPNAFSVGDGTIVINIGLLPQIENEDQLAFILCHEFSHYFLKHWEKTITHRLESYNSSAFKAKLDRINESEYYQVTKLKELIRENLYSERSFNRSMEVQADSLGLEMYLRTKYAPYQAARTMQVLDSMKDIALVGKQFDIFQYMGAQRVQLETGSFIDPQDRPEGDLQDDSIASHPDTKLRYELLKKKLDDKKANTKAPAKSTMFADMRDVMRFEYIESLIAVSCYDKAFIYTLRKLEDEPDNRYLRSVATYCQFRFCEGRKNHHVGLYVYPPHKTSDTTYSELSQYIFASRFNTLTDIAFKYSLKYYKEFPDDERILFSLVMMYKYKEDEAGFKKYRNEYFSKFPKGDFKNQIPRI